MVLDLCSGTSLERAEDALTSTTFDNLSKCRVATPIPGLAQALNFQGPLQLGGIQSNLDYLFLRRIPYLFSLNSFEGCFRNLRVNGEVRLYLC